MKRDIVPLNDPLSAVTLRIDYTPKPIGYPFAACKSVGDNFTVPYSKARSAATCARQYAQRHNLDWRFITRRNRDAKTALVIRVE